MHKLMTYAALGVSLLAPSAQAQSANCAAHDVVAARLAEGWGETRQSIGLAADNSVVEIYAALDTGTWSITITRPGGPTCLVASGQAFQHLAEALPDVDEGA